MQGMRELLRSSLGRSLSALSPADKLAAAWPVACGRSMAEHGEIVAFADGRVTIEVRDSTWLQQMLAMRGQLTAELRRIAAVDLREIHFQRSGATAQDEDGARSRSAGRRPVRRYRSKS